MARHGGQSTCSSRTVTGLVFLSFLAIGVVWALAVPRFSQPDEGAHVVRSAAVAAGNLVGGSLTAENRESYDAEQARRRDQNYAPLPRPSALVIVSVPESLASGLIQRACYARRPAVTPAECPGLSSATSQVDSWTWQGRNPPMVHMVMGLVTVVDPSATAVWLMRFVGVGMTAALLTAAFGAARRLGGAAPLGLLLAMTPMVLYLNAGATTNGIEISAGLALFAGLVALWRTHDSRWRHMVGVSAVTVALARPLGPLFVVAILAVVMVWGGNPRQILRLGWVWMSVVVASVVVAVGWLVGSGALSGGSNTNWPSGNSAQTVVVDSVGDWALFVHQMVGVFDADRTTFISPVVVVLWLTAMAGLGLLVRRSRRQTLVVMGLAAGVLFVLPAVMQGISADGAGSWWRGRYQLPAWVGVSVLLAAGSWRRPQPDVATIGVRWAVAILFVVGQLGGLWTAIRRFTAGEDSSLWFLGEMRWSPPLPVGILLGVFTLAAVTLAVVAWRASAQPSGLTFAYSTPTPNEHMPMPG